MVRRRREKGKVQAGKAGESSSFIHQRKGGQALGQSPAGVLDIAFFGAPQGEEGIGMGLQVFLLQGVEKTPGKGLFAAGTGNLIIQAQGLVSKGAHPGVAAVGDGKMELRKSRKAPGENRIWTAGEMEAEAWNIRKETGCPIPPALQKEISELTKKFSLSFSWPWE